MEQPNYVTNEDFFYAHEVTAKTTLARSLAQWLWDVKSGDLTQDGKDADFEMAQEFQSQWLKKFTPEQMKWHLKISEKSTIIDINEWVEWSMENSKNEVEQAKLGYPDLDFNIETQILCGNQMADFHEAQWAKEKLLNLWENEGFKEVTHKEFKFNNPMTRPIFEMERELDGVDYSMSHPCSVTLSVASIWLEIQDGNQSQWVPIVRKEKVTSLEKMHRRLKEAVKERNEMLKNTIEEKKEILGHLPEGWPNDQVFEKVMEWKNRDFLGDRGLMGSDFFEGHWMEQLKGLEVRRKFNQEEINVLNDIEQKNQLIYMKERLEARKKTKDEKFVERKIKIDRL